MLNQCQFIGNLGADPEVRSMQNGDKIVNLRLAVTEKWRDKASGERREKTEWVRVSIFDQGLAKVAEQYLRKGSQLYVSGQLETRKWQDQSGADRYSTDVVLRPFRSALTMLGGKPEGEREEPLRGRDGTEAPRSQRQSAPAYDLDDDIPF